MAQPADSAGFKMHMHGIDPRVALPQHAHSQQKHDNPFTAVFATATASQANDLDDEEDVEEIEIDDTGVVGGDSSSNEDEDGDEDLEDEDEPTAPRTAQKQPAMRSVNPQHVTPAPHTTEHTMNPSALHERSYKQQQAELGAAIVQKRSGSRDEREKVLYFPSDDGSLIPVSCCYGTRCVGAKSPFKHFHCPLFFKSQEEMQLHYERLLNHRKRAQWLTIMGSQTWCQNAECACLEKIKELGWKETQHYHCMFWQRSLNLIKLHTFSKHSLSFITSKQYAAWSDPQDPKADPPQFAVNLTSPTMAPKQKKFPKVTAKAIAALPQPNPVEMKITAAESEVEIISPSKLHTSSQNELVHHHHTTTTATIDNHHHRSPSEGVENLTSMIKANHAELLAKFDEFTKTMSKRPDERDGSKVQGLEDRLRFVEMQLNAYKSKFDDVFETLLLTKNELESTKRKLTYLEVRIAQDNMDLMTPTDANGLQLMGKRPKTTESPPVGHMQHMPNMTPLMQGLGPSLWQNK